MLLLILSLTAGRLFGLGSSFELELELELELDCRVELDGLSMGPIVTRSWTVVPPTLFGDAYAAV